MALVRKEAIEGRTFDLNVDGDGRFYADVDDERAYSTTIKGLIEKLRKDLRMRRAKIEVSWTERDWNNRDGDGKLKVVDGFLVGVHATQGDFLLRNLDGKAEQQARYHSLLRRLSEADKKKFYELQRQVVAAEKVFEHFKKSLEVDGNVLLENARKKAEP